MCLACPCQAQLTAEETSTGLVGIRCKPNLMKRMAGTGFWISENYILTAKHCSDGPLTVHTQGLKLDAIKTHEGNTFSDWALLYVANPPKHAVLRLDRTTIDSVPAWVYGDFRLDGGKIKCNGGVIRGAHCSAKVYPGFSGGPVVNSYGCVVGIVSAQWPVTNTCVLVPLSQVTW